MLLLFHSQTAWTVHLIFEEHRFFKCSHNYQWLAGENLQKWLIASPFCWLRKKKKTFTQIQNCIYDAPYLGDFLFTIFWWPVWFFTSGRELLELIENSCLISIKRIDLGLLLNLGQGFSNMKSKGYIGFYFY